MPLFSLSGFGVKSPCDDGSEHCWCLLSCVANTSGPVAKSISAVNPELPWKSSPSCPRGAKLGGGPEHRAKHPAGTTPWCWAAQPQIWELSTSENQLLPPQSSPLPGPKFPAPRGNQGRCLAFRYSWFCSLLIADPQGDTQCSELSAFFLCACCHSAVLKVIHAAVVMSLCSRIYSIAHGLWLITITRALTDFRTTRWWLLLMPHLFCYASAHIWFQTNTFLRCGPWQTGRNPRSGGWAEGRAAGGRCPWWFPGAAFWEAQAEMSLLFCVRFS